MTTRICYRINDADILLTQSGIDRFAVHYGKQVDRDLSYSDACSKLGQAILHHLACIDELDNRMKGEKKC